MEKIEGSIADMLKGVNAKISDLELKKGMKSKDEVKAEENRVNELIENGNVFKNATLNPSAAPGAFMAYKICTANDFLDLSCNRDYLLSELLSDGYLGADLAELTIQRVIDTEGKLLSLPDYSSCDIPSITKNAKIVCISQAILSGACDVHYSMLTGGASREQVLYNIIERVLAKAFANSFEDDLINGDTEVTASNINGIAKPANDIPGFFNHNGLRKNALIGYDKPDTSGKSCTFTEFEPEELENTTYNFNETLTIGQIFEFLGKLETCCSDALIVLDCATWNKIMSIAVSQSMVFEPLREMDAFNVRGSLYRFLGHTWYVSNNVGKVLPTGLTDATPANNTHHYMLAINPKAIVRGFANSQKFGTLDKGICQQLYTAAYYGFGICTDPVKPNVIAGINIKI